MPDTLDLARLEKLLAEATPGPWKAQIGPATMTTTHDGFNPDRQCPYQGGGWSVVRMLDSGKSITVVGGSWNDYNRREQEANAAIIAAAPHLLSRIFELESAQEWQPIETLETWRTDHVRTVLAYWTTRGVCETYWDEDGDYDTRPKGWVSPREGWRSPGDMCIPINQDCVTHWRPLPAPPQARNVLGEKA